MAKLLSDAGYFCERTWRGPAAADKFANAHGIHVDAGVPFICHETKYSLGSAQIHQVWHSGAQFSAASSEPLGHRVIVLYTQPIPMVSPDASHPSAQTGEWSCEVLTDAGYAHSWGGESAQQIIALTLPMTSVAERALSGGRVKPTEVTDNPLLRPIASYAASLTEAFPLPSSSALECGRLLSQMLDGALFLCLQDEEGSRHAQLCAKAKVHIETHAHEKTFTPDELAQHLYVSQRQLQKSFAMCGETVSGAIRLRRGQIAFGLLTAPGTQHLTVQEIADESGFGSSDTLRREMVRQYGKSPRQLRHGDLSGLEMPARALMS